MARPGFNKSSCLFNNWWSNVGTDDYRPGVQGCNLLWNDRTSSPSGGSQKMMRVFNASELGSKLSYRELLADPTVDENGAVESHAGGIRVVGIIALVLFVVYIYSLNK